MYQSESWQSWWLRLRLNLLPAYWTTGGHITYISKEFNEVHVKLPVNWHTRTPVGSLFGSTIYGAVEPLYALMLCKLLGKDYIVWDRGGKITFKQPALSSLYAKLLITPFKLTEIKQTVDKKQEYNFYFKISIKDKFEKIISEIHQTLYIARKDFYKIRMYHKKQELNHKNYEFH